MSSLPIHPILVVVELFLDQNSPKHFCKTSATNTQFLEAHWKKYVFWITHVILKLDCAYKTVKWRRDERLLGKDVNELFPSHLQMQSRKRVSLSLCVIEKSNERAAYWAHNSWRLDKADIPSGTAPWNLLLDMCLETFKTSDMLVHVPFIMFCLSIRYRLC